MNRLFWLTGSVIFLFSLPIACGGGTKFSSDGPSVASMGGAVGGSANASGGRKDTGSADAGGIATGGTSEGGSTPDAQSSSACSGCQPLEECWNEKQCIAKLVAVPSGYSIDATEVTRAQYKAWLITLPTTTQQVPECAWNDDFHPDAMCMADTSVCQGTGCSNHPQVCIDLCDALAYCKAIGKHLCGGIGVSTKERLGASNDPTKSEWMNACTSGGVNRFTFGDYSDDLRKNPKCNDFFAVKTTTVPVASVPGCQSPIPGYSGIFDLIGNVAEWEDSCFSVGPITGTNTEVYCSSMGLSFGQGAAMPECASRHDYQTTRKHAAVGFRCCKQ